MSKLAYSGKLLLEFIGFARENKVYWLVPLVIILALSGVLIFTSQTVTPFVYTLF